jgi:hypothetical protein
VIVVSTKGDADHKGTNAKNGRSAAKNLAQELLGEADSQIRCSFLEVASYIECKACRTDDQEHRTCAFFAS